MKRKAHQPELAIDGGFSLITETAADGERITRERAELASAMAADEAKQEEFFEPWTDARQKLFLARCQTVGSLDA